MLVFPSQGRVDRLFLLLNYPLQASFASARQLSALLNLLESLAPIIPSGNYGSDPYKRSSQVLDSTVRFMGSPLSSQNLVPQSHSGLEQSSESPQRSSRCSSSLRSSSIHGCIHYRMGSPHGLPHTSDTWTPQESSLHFHILELESVSRALH